MTSANLAVSVMKISWTTRKSPNAAKIESDFDRSSSAFARGMSELMEQFSERFRQDLCRAVSSHAKVPRQP
jgi:hypothetical protein